MSNEMYIKNCVEQFEKLLNEQYVRAEKMKNAPPAIDYAKLDKIIKDNKANILLDTNDLRSIMRWNEDKKVVSRLYPPRVLIWTAVVLHASTLS